MVSGSMVKVQKVSDNLVLYYGSSSTPTVEFAGDVKIIVRKGTASPTYKEWITQTTLVSGATTTVTALQELDE